MPATPTQIKAHRDTGEFEIHWSDGSAYRLPFKYVRGECPCAACIDEWTGKRILDLNTIPDEIQPDQLAPRGNYAVHITWSDGHASGLYTWDLLYEICKRA